MKSFINRLKAFFTNKLKSKYVLDIEEIFFELENLGFRKLYQSYGFEYHMNYSNDNFKVKLIWTAENNNPWIIFKINEVEYDLSIVRDKLLQQNSFNSTNKLKQNYFLNTLIPRKEYLIAYLNEILIQINS